MLKLALPSFLAPVPLRDALGRVKDAGADGVRLDLRSELRAADLSATARRELRHRLREHGLAAGPAVFPTRGALHASDRLDERVAGVTAALQLAADLGCDTLTLRPFAPPAVGQSGDGEGDDGGEAALLVEVLSDVARAGQHVGVIPCVTPAGNPRRWAETVAAVSTGPVGVNLDPAAVLRAGGDPAAAARATAGLIRTVTARDALADGAGGREVPVGRGEVDWEELLALLDEANFRGWTTCDRTEGPDRFAEASRAVGYLRKVAGR